MNKNFFKTNFLNSKDVDFIKNEFKLNPDFKKISNLDLLLQYEKGKIIFNNKLIEKIEKNLGLKNYIFLNVVKILNPRNTNLKSGWHVDYGNFDHQRKVLIKKNNFIYKIGLYLQENTKDKGGGIDLLKMITFNNYKNKSFFMSFLRKAYNFFLIRFCDNTVYSNEGDVIGFTGYSYHRTTPSEISGEKKNYNIYFLLTNLETIKDSLDAYDKMYKTNKKDLLFENIKTKKIDDLEISIMSKDYSSMVEHILGDTL